MVEELGTGVHLRGNYRVPFGLLSWERKSGMYLSEDRVYHVDWSPGERFERICAEITVAAREGGDLSKIHWLNLCECPQLEESLLIFLTVHPIQQHSCFQSGPPAIIGPW